MNALDQEVKISRSRFIFEHVMSCSNHYLCGEIGEIDFVGVFRNRERYEACGR